MSRPPVSSSHRPGKGSWNRPLLRRPEAQVFETGRQQDSVDGQTTKVTTNCFSRHKSCSSHGLLRSGEGSWFKKKSLREDL